MASFVCPNCGRNLSASDRLTGQVRKCPKCGMSVEIPPGPLPPIAAEESSVPASLQQDSTSRSAILASHRSAGKSFHVPDRLSRNSHYLVCDPAQLVATWENNGRGWMLHTNSGMVVARRNLDRLPSHGDFTLVELNLSLTDAGLRLEHVTAYQLGQRWALTRIEKGDDRILAGIVGPGCLNREQKTVVRNLIKSQFVGEVWEKAGHVMEYLGNTDYHSAGV